MKILIIVDIQNCFITGGSLSSNNPNSVKNYINQVIKIDKYIKENKYDLVVFTRDSHPEYHSSLHSTINPEKGVFVPHCRNSNIKCDITYKDNEYIKVNEDKTTIKESLNIIKHMQIGDEGKTYINDLFSSLGDEDISINGIDLSYLFYGISELKDIVKQLNADTNYNHTITLINKENNIRQSPKKEFINYKIDPIIKDNTKYIAITKGEYCEYDAYSAFNYHQYIKKDKNKQDNDPKNNIIEQLKASEDNTTGLLEYILENSISNNIEIHVCGLVTDICVMSTVHQGLMMWNLYKDKYPDKKIEFTLLEYLSLPLLLNNRNTIKTTEELENTIKYLTQDLDKVIKINKITSNAQHFDIKYTLSYIINQINQSGSGGVEIHNNCTCIECEEFYKQKYLKYKNKYMMKKLIK